MERLPAIPTTTAAARAPRRSVAAARWVRPVCAVLVAVGPPVARAAWRHRSLTRLAAGRAPEAPVALERTELWLERRRLGRVRLHVRATRWTGTGDRDQLSRERRAEAGAAPWGTAARILWRLLGAALGTGGTPKPASRLPPGRG
ncbi:MAG TPA: hypothetical protein VMW47_07710 [Verrucomicrobiae bacterium]|nr:hypothetical protein [Verrucomicrobiae bacterium]